MEWCSHDKVLTFLMLQQGMENALCIGLRLVARFVIGELPKTVYSNLFHNEEFQVILLFEFY